MEKTVKTLVIVFALLGLGLLGYYWINQWHNRALSNARAQEKALYVQRIAQLEAQVQKLTAEAGQQTPSAAAKAEIADVFGSGKPLSALQDETTDCNKITAQALAFFQYLDSKSYLTRPGINMPAEEFFEDVFRRLAAHPPTNVGEMNNMYTLLRNVTHLYRVLGKDRVDAIKEIMHSESAVMEPAMAVLFAWITKCDAGANHPIDANRLKALYQYAGFFINTMGGRSYLLRRDSKTRLLINYYSLRIVDMANDAKLNSYGIDIRPYIDYLFYDINNQKGLMYRQRYLAHLAALKNKYQ